MGIERFCYCSFVGDFSIFLQSLIVQYSKLVEIHREKKLKNCDMKEFISTNLNIN